LTFYEFFGAKTQKKHPITGFSNLLNMPKMTPKYPQIWPSGDPPDPPLGGSGGSNLGVWGVIWAYWFYWETR